MTSPTCDHEPDTTTDSLSNELDHWKRRVHALPPVREEKIAAARAAMTRNASLARSSRTPRSSGLISSAPLSGT